MQVKKIKKIDTRNIPNKQKYAKKVYFTCELTDTEVDIQIHIQSVGSTISTSLSSAMVQEILNNLKEFYQQMKDLGAIELYEEQEKQRERNRGGSILC